MKHTKIAAVLGAVLAIALTGTVSAHTSAAQCDAIVISNTPQNHPAYIYAGYLPIGTPVYGPVGNGTYAVTAGVYVIEWPAWDANGNAPGKGDNSDVRLVAACNPEVTPSPTPTPTPTPSPTPSSTPSPTPSTTPSPTPSPSPSATPTPTPTATPTPSPTPTATPPVCEQEVCATPTPSTSPTPTPSTSASPFPTLPPTDTTGSPTGSDADLVVIAVLGMFTLIGFLAYTAKRERSNWR